MLQNGAELVFAVDVGTNQLAWKLRQDPRVISMEQFNSRYAEKTDFEQEPSFAKVHQTVLESFTAMAVEQGFSVLGLDYSPIQGGHGNIAFLAYLKKEEGASNQVAPEIEKVVERAHREFKDE